MTPSDPPFAELGLAGARALLIASAGGHVAQLAMIARAAPVHPGSVVVTFPGVQATDLARDFEVVEVPYIPPRGWYGAATVYPSLSRVLRHRHFDVAVSTGSALAVPGLLAARSRGVRSMYVESYTRFDSPSVAGRILQRVPGIETYAQHPGWPRPWGYAGNVLDVLEHQPAAPTVDRVRSLFVTLGTIQPYRFDAVVDRLLALLPPDVDVTWQTGATTRRDLPGTVHETMPSEAFDQAILDADLVVTHGGTGTILRLLTLGKPAMLVPRRARRDEHVDDHQVPVCAEFASRGLAVNREADALSAADFGWRTSPEPTIQPV